MKHSETFDVCAVRHPGAGRDPERSTTWIPACAGMTNQTILSLCSMLLAGFMVLASGNAAAELITIRLLSLDMARDIASSAIESCRKDGYQVSVVVTDRSGEALVVMRDVYSNRYFTQLAQGKANAVIMANTSSAELRRNRADMVNELNLLDGVMVLAGGLPVQAAGSLLGAVGVSGAPGGDLDEACARAGIEVVQEDLEFAD